MKPQAELLGGNSTTPFFETRLKIGVVHASKQPGGNSTKTGF